MTKALLLLPLALTVAACATPRERCLNDANRELRVMASLIQETQENLARGYALDTRQEVTTIEKTCNVRQEDGSVLRTPCPEVITTDYQVPVAIDLNAEEAKLQSLLQRQTQMLAASQAAAQQCIATYPE